MEIISVPDNYDGAYGELIYRLSGADPENVTEVEIMSQPDGHVLGIKRYRGEPNFDVNISGYLKGRINVEPEFTDRCGVRFPPGRVAEGWIKVGNVLSPKRIFTGGIRKAALMEVLSSAPKRQSISRGDVDEISINVPQGETLDISGYLTDCFGESERVCRFNITGSGAMAAMVINADDIAAWAENYGNHRDEAKYNSFEVNYAHQGNIILARRYDLKPKRKNSVRLCWVNSFGAIDYYTFAQGDITNISAYRNKIYTSEGYKIYGSETEKTFILSSEYENEKTLGWLKEILNSPKVWISQESSFMPVDVVTSQMQIMKSAPQSLAIQVREIKKTTYQNN